MVGPGIAVRCRRLVVQIAVTFMLAASMGAPAAEGEGVGVVAAYRPATSKFSFTRPPHNEAVSVRIGTVVMAGDQVTLPERASLVIQLEGGRTSELGPGEHTIRDTGPIGKVKAAVYRSISGVFDAEYRREGLAGSRGNEQCAAEGQAVPAIEVPILAPGAQIVAGERDLPLAWRGGCAPFVVTVLAGGQKLVHRESIEGRQIRLDDVPLAVGRYAVVITDADGRRFEGPLEAVSAGPTVPTEIAADTTSLGVVAQAIWLAQHEDGRWRLDSFERLRPLIRAGDSLAGTIGDGVLWGGGAP